MAGLVGARHGALRRFGHVAPDRSDFAWNRFETTYGLGFRFHSNDAFVGRLDLAFSPEGFIPLLRFVYVF
jgi:hypothetical protein